VVGRADRVRLLVFLFSILLGNRIGRWIAVGWCQEHISIFRTDIQPKGFQVVGFDEFLSRETIDHARAVLNDSSLAHRMVDHNYELGRKHYSYAVLRTCLRRLVERSCEQSF